MGASDNSSTRFPIPGATPQNPHCSQLVVRKSRFLAQSCHCDSSALARSFAERIRGQWPDATHNCWAFVAGPPGSTASIGSSDDGEPHGTAGKPILHALLHSGTGQICMVVSRWFGGVKLGAGGLARAYQQSALENMASLPLKESIRLSRWKIIADYEHVDNLHRLLPGLEARITGAEYHSRAELTLEIPEDRAEELVRLAARASNGRAGLERLVPHDKTPGKVYD